MQVHLKPRQEAFIQHGIDVGRFATADEAIEAAVSLLERSQGPLRTGADLVDAMQASPHKDVELEPSRPHLTVRDITV